MWRNHEVLDFIHWLRDHNLQIRSPDRRVGFYGLDLYILFTSIEPVLEYLDRVDPEAARICAGRYRQQRRFLANRFGEQSREQARPGSDIGHRLSGLNLTRGDNLFATCKYFAAFDLEAVDELRDVRIAKRVVDSWKNAPLLANSGCGEDGNNQDDEQVQSACHVNKSSSCQRARPSWQRVPCSSIDGEIFVG
jgi:hypothetical protein